MSGMGGADSAGAPPMSACPAGEFDGHGRGLNPTFQEERRRELFPLPRASPPASGSGLSTSSRRRKAPVRGLVEESNKVIDSLNEMYAPQQATPQGDCTLAQRASQHAIFKQLAHQPRAQQQCSMREAVQELLQCDSSYSQEDFVSTVRPYQRDLISLPETGDDPVSLDQVLDEHGQVLGDPLRSMLLSDEEWGEVLEKGELVRPYMDVRLQHDQQLY